jgi:hypothetical protein
MTSLTSASSQGEGGQSGGWTPLDSSSIHSVAFVPGENTLKIHFRDGDTWSYANVPKDKYKGILYANSSGAYLRNHIIPHHEATKLHDGAPEDIDNRAK